MTFLNTVLRVLMLSQKQPTKVFCKWFVLHLSRS